jgi:hypothetical protein
MARKFLAKFSNINLYQNTLPFPAIVYGQTDKRNDGQNNFKRNFATIEMLLKWRYRKQKLEEMKGCDRSSEINENNTYKERGCKPQNTQKKTGLS